MPNGAVLVEVDFITKPTSYDDGGFQSYGYRMVYGINNRTEVGANFFYTWDGNKSVGEAQFSAKRKLYHNEKTGIALSGGVMAFVPLRSRASEKPFVMTYATGSKTFGKLHGLRLTGGAYTFFGTNSNFGTRTGALAAFELPITRRVSIVGDWSSGRNRLGYSTIGFKYNITSNQFIMAGYNFGNYGGGDHALSVFYGYIFQ
jgi:hypothetical protein